MSETQEASRGYVVETERAVDVLDLLYGLWARKLVVALCCAVLFVASIQYASSLPNLYKATAVLAPVEESGGGLGGLLNQYSGIASLAGVSLPNNSSIDDTVLALETLKSRSFLQEFIERRGLLPYLLAYLKWDPADSEDVFDDSLFDKDSSVWLKKSTGESARPSNELAFVVFVSNLLIDQERKTGIVKISYTHESPEVAASITNWLVEDINRQIKEQEVVEAADSIAYLEKQIPLTNVADLRQMLYALIQSQTETIMLAEVRQEYVFKIIDPAIPPAYPNSPNRGRIAIIGGFLGFVLGMLIAGLLHFRHSSQQ